MQIRRVILKGVRNFVDFDYSFEDSWSGRVPEALLLIGPNGSGKTTLLNVIADLWQVLANSLREDEAMLIPGSILPYCNFAAVEIVGLEHEPVWICSGIERTLWEVVAAQTDSHRIGAFPARLGLPPYRYYSGPGATEIEKIDQLADWQRELAQRLTENLLGKRQDLSNMVYLESESRVMLPVNEKFSVQPEPDEFRWLARYEPTNSRKGSLQNYLYNLKVVDDKSFQQIVEQVNAFLIGKKLDGFDRRTGDLLVEIEGRGKHSITELSSGEKQVLLMLATVTRWLRPGGIVLIDEPDLHLHASLTTAFVSHLRRMVSAKDGQLLIASHAPELWQDFTTSHRVELGRVGEVAR